MELMYISLIISIRSKPHSSPWFSAACAAAIVQRFFRLNQQYKSCESKVKLRHASCKIISLQTSLQIIAKWSLKLQNLLLIKLKSPWNPKNLALRTLGLLIGLLFSNLGVLSSTSVKAKLFPKNLSKNSNIDDLVISNPCFPF